MPLKVLKEAATIGFLHKKLGEIWYVLNLQAEEGGSVRLPVMKCELGKNEKHEVLLENPSDKEVQVTYEIEDKNHFIVEPSEIVIQPRSAFSACVVYTPSGLDKLINCKIKFITKTIGIWNYLCFG